MLSSETRAPSVSVIIPLEFHRGQAGNCLELWLAGQTHPREDFEIILACPPDFPQEERRAIQAKMAAWDRLIEFPLHHDIALVEQGAKLAQGAYFFFTESHVLPEPDTLAKVMRAFQDHPEWAGFSLQSVPIIHNFLSRVEAEFYAMGIEPSETKPQWCQVLDQCFAVRRQPYFNALGFQAEFGHYAEWVLAARLHAAGHVIGYFPGGRINHYYIGELPDLEEFTRDFAVGHWRWFAQTAREPAHALMQPPAVFSRRFENNRPLAKALAKIARQASGGTGGTFHWRLVSWFGLRGPLWLSRWKYAVSRIRLISLCRRKKPSALSALVELSRAIVDIAQQKELLKLPAPEPASLAECGEWTASNASLPFLGLYGPEQAAAQAFCWSQPAALVQLDLPPGRYQLEMEWLALRPDLVQPQLFLNGHAVAAEKQRRFKFRVRCSWHQKTAEPLHFAWTCGPFQSAGDDRPLAVPVSRISWKPQVSDPLPVTAHAEAA